MLPKVENPIPDTIGLGAIFSLAGAGGVLLLVLTTLLDLPDERRNTWSRHGMVGGFVGGSILYATALLNQIL